MPFQINIAVTFNPDERPDRKWSGFVKFDCPVADENGFGIQCVLVDSDHFEGAVYPLLRSESLLKYARLGAENEEGASQNAEGLVN